MKFSDLSLAEPIQRAIATEGYTEPTPIQAQAIPLVLAGRDLFGCAQTGTGKTAAFALPILHRLDGSRRRRATDQNPAQADAAPAARAAHPAQSQRRIRALVLSPTRELAAQIGESFCAYGRNLPLRTSVIFGGVSQHPQVRALRHGVDILVATPGRLLDLLDQGYVDLRHVEAFVLDEADRMLDLGFFPDIRKVVARLPVERQTLLFSATMPDDIRKLAHSILRDPANVHVAPVSSTAERIEQGVYHVSKRNKPALLRHLLQDAAIERALVFTRTKRGADRVVRDLSRAGLQSAAIHGDKSQAQRERALEGFRTNRLPILVATDIAARGIDVDAVSHVFNYDVPQVAETYVHRIGRTARAGASGIALSFCDDEERGDLRAIEKLIRKPLPVRTDHPEYPARTGEPAGDAAPPRFAAAAGRPDSQGNRRPSGNGRSRGRRRFHQTGGPRTAQNASSANGSANTAAMKRSDGNRSAHPHENNGGGSGARSRGRRRRRYGRQPARA